MCKDPAGGEEPLMGEAAAACEWKDDGKWTNEDGMFGGQASCPLSKISDKLKSGSDVSLITTYNIMRGDKSYMPAQPADGEMPTNMSMITLTDNSVLLAVAASGAALLGALTF